jgi:hypothetical protein
VQSPWRGIEDTLLFAAAGVSVAVLVTMFLSFPIGAYAFYNPDLGGTARDATVNSLPLLFFGINQQIPLPVSTSFGEFFLIVWAINLTFFVFALLGPWSGLLSSLRRLRLDKNLAVYSNSALTLGIVFPASLVLAALLEYFLNSAGLPVGSLTDTDPRYLFLLSTFAPLREELGFRVCFIGLACALIVYSSGKGSVLKALWHPSRAMSEAGIQIWRQGALFGAIALSSLAFGAAHVIYGGGWEIGKFFSAATIGVLFGVVYFTHGFPTAVLLHWGFDYYQTAFTDFDQIRGVLDSSGNPLPGMSLSSTSFGIDLLLVLGAALAIAYVLAIFFGTLATRRRTAFKAAEQQEAVVQSFGGGRKAGLLGAAKKVLRN